MKHINNLPIKEWNMIKKITLLTALIALSGCSSYYEMKNCDPSKNYINSNPEEMEKYKKLVNNGNVKSYYLKIIPMIPCKNNKCLPYDSKKYDFQELYFNDTMRNGIYTIKISSKLKDPNCFEIKYSNNKKCYTVTKNKNNEVHSQYYLEKIRDNNFSYTKFIDLKHNVILFESSSQSYHVKNISDAPSGITCQSIKNPENYIFSDFYYP